MNSFKELLKKEFLEKLNIEQQKAVSHFTGPMLIFAGAGSGKTRVITHRIAYLIRIYDIPAGSIVAVTFTNKAAEEMKKRVLDLIGPYGERVTIKTFHSLGLQIIRENYKEVGLNSNFSIYDSSSQKTLAKKILKHLKVDTSTLSVNDFLQKIHLARDEFLDPEIFYNKNINHYNIDLLYNFYKMYIEELRNNNALDFGDLLYESVFLFKKKPDILTQYQNRWKFLMIDEYQDTNYVQYLLAKLISQNHKNIIVVGDDDQSIYSWRGAKIENIWNFQKDFPETKIVKLEQNYRSTNQILKIANNIIKYNSNRSDKQLYSTIQDGDEPILWECYDEYDEARKIVNEIIKLKEYYDLTDIAIFYRMNAQSRVIEQILREYNLPYLIYGGIRFFERKEIKDILSYLQFIINPFDFESFERMIENPPKGIGTKTLEKIKEISINSKKDIISTISTIIKEKMIRNTKNLEQFYNKLNNWLKTPQDPLYNFVKTIIDESGILEYYQKELNPENISRIENIKEFLQSISEYEQQKKLQNKMVNLAEYLQEISLFTSEENIDSFNQNLKGIQLMTLHNAKGLEFQIVFLTGLEEEILPHQLSIEENNIEEERRLVYVGITRAKRKLYLTYCKYRNKFGLLETKTPSRYLYEMGLFNISNSNSNNFSNWNTKEAHYYQNNNSLDNEDFIINEKYSHEKFGIGILKDIEIVSGKKILTIEFFNGLKKRFLANYTSLKKL